MSPSLTQMYHVVENQFFTGFMGHISRIAIGNAGFIYSGLGNKLWYSCLLIGSGERPIRKPGCIVSVLYFDQRDIFVYPGWGFRVAPIELCEILFNDCFTFEDSILSIGFSGKRTASYRIFA